MLALARSKEHSVELVRLIILLYSYMNAPSVMLNSQY